jgi:hypothetical protein
MNRKGRKGKVNSKYIHMSTLILVSINASKLLIIVLA